MKQQICTTICILVKSVYALSSNYVNYVIQQWTVYRCLLFLPLFVVRSLMSGVGTRRNEMSRRFSIPITFVVAAFTGLLLLSPGSLDGRGGELGYHCDKTCLSDSQSILLCRLSSVQSSPFTHLASWRKEKRKEITTTTPHNILHCFFLSLGFTAHFTKDAEKFSAHSRNT